LPSRVSARYEAALADPTLLSLRDDIALLQAMVADIMAKTQDGEAQVDVDRVLRAVEQIAADSISLDHAGIVTELGKLRQLIVRCRSERAAMRAARELIREKAKLIAQESRLLADREAYVSVEQFLLTMRAIGAAVRQLVDDPEILRRIDGEVRRLVDRPERGRA
jgi:hypothetical protein